MRSPGSASKPNSTGRPRLRLAICQCVTSRMMCVSAASATSARKMHFAFVPRGTGIDRAELQRDRPVVKLSQARDVARGNGAELRREERIDLIAQRPGRRVAQPGQMFADPGGGCGAGAVADQPGDLRIDAMCAAGRIAAGVRDYRQAQRERIGFPGDGKIDLDIVDQSVTRGFLEARVLGGIVPAGAQRGEHSVVPRQVDESAIFAAPRWGGQSCRDTTRHKSGTAL